MEDFNRLDDVTVEEVNVSDQKKEQRRKENKAQKDEMKRMFQETLQKDPGIKDRLKTLSNSVCVVNTLGFADSGNIRVDDKGKTGNKKDRDENLVKTSKIVGYRIKNIGETPIKFMTEEYAPNEEGVFVGTKVQKVMEPGQTVELARKYMTILCSMPEISFQLQNGKVIRGSAKNDAKKFDMDTELEAYYFTFDDNAVSVNDDVIKQNVGKKVTDKEGKTKWVVKKEFLATFGFLNNQPEGHKTRRASESRTYNTQDIAANYIAQMLEKNGML